MNTDLLMLLAIVGILLISNGMIFAINEEFGSSTSENLIGEPTFGNVATFFLGIFVWTFGALPTWVDILFLILRAFGYIIFWKIVIRGVST